jgi:hypothetical protein
MIYSILLLRYGDRKGISQKSYGSSSTQLHGDGTYLLYPSLKASLLYPQATYYITSTLPTSLPDHLATLKEPHCYYWRGSGQ